MHSNLRASKAHLIGVDDGVGDYSEGHVYLKDTEEERRYGASVIRDLGIIALPGDSGMI